MDHVVLNTSAPTQENRRIEVLDVLRGFAILGILVPNIVAFAWPQMAMSESKVFGLTLDLLGEGPANEHANVLAHLITQVFFHGKMMFLFGLLFGVGVVMFDRKSSSTIGEWCSVCRSSLRGLGRENLCPQCGSMRRVVRKPRLRDGAGLWYRRMAWLLAIGLAHAVLFWFGDILVWYAVSGLGLVWWVRRLKPELLLLIAIPMYLFGILLLVGMTVLGVVFHQSGSFDLFKTIPDELRAYTGSFVDALIGRLWTLVQMYLFMVPIFSVSITGIMLAGIALTRLGILTGERSNRLYVHLAIFGFVFGFGLTGLVIWGLHVANVPLPGMFFAVCGQLFGIPTSLGYAAFLILIVKNGWVKLLTTALAAVGRMALSNYMLQSIICTTFFYGYGFGQFAKIQYPQLWLVVACVWGVNIAFSMLWLRTFQFGPLEWVWRCLTYWRIMPLRRKLLSRDAG